MSDPTRIDLQADPTKMVISGTARHGNTVFVCPVISHIEGNLWQGGCQNGLVLPTDIKHLVSLYPWEAFTVNHKLGSELSIVAYDSEPQHIAPMLDGLASWISACMDDGPTLVHCQAGLNRSGLVAALVLMKRGRSAREAIDLLRATRSPAVLCNKSFEAWLLAR